MFDHTAHSFIEIISFSPDWHKHSSKMKRGDVVCIHLRIHCVASDDQKRSQNKYFLNVKRNIWDWKASIIHLQSLF